MRRWTPRWKVEDKKGTIFPDIWQCVRLRDTVKSHGVYVSLQSAAKRFNVTGSGKVTVRRAGKNHFQEKKSSKRRNKLSMKQQASDSMLDNIKGCLPYSKIK